MKIKFVIDYKGRETNYIKYCAGDVVLLPDAFAERLISDKSAERLSEPAPEKKSRKES